MDMVTAALIVDRGFDPSFSEITLSALPRIGETIMVIDADNETYHLKVFNILYIAGINIDLELSNIYEFEETVLPQIHCHLLET